MVATLKELDSKNEKYNEVKSTVPSSRSRRKKLVLETFSEFERVFKPLLTTGTVKSPSKSKKIHKVICKPEQTFFLLQGTQCLLE